MSYEDGYPLSLSFMCNRFNPYGRHVLLFYRSMGAIIYLKGESILESIGPQLLKLLCFQLITKTKIQSKLLIRRR